MIQVIRGRIVTPDEIIDDGAVRVEGGRIVDVHPAGDPGPTGHRCPGHRGAAWVLPAFVDLHAHGGGGHTFATGDPDQARAVAAFHGAHGTTTLLASLVAGPYEQLRAATLALGPLVAEGVLAGVHHEGPYLSPARCGAQPPAYLRDPDLAELTSLLDLGVVRMVTLAPELPGALELFDHLRQRGVLAAVGHTDATYRQTLTAIEHGAVVATHLGNAMRPIHHREPGPVVALLDAPSVVCEVIADGVHLHPGMLRHIVRAAGPDRVALVTDATAAAGMPDGEYELGGRPIAVTNQVARLAAPGAADGILAGSTLTMDRVLRYAVHSGVEISRAARMAATTPARTLGLDGELGAITPGLRADLVLLDENLRVLQVLRAGRPYPHDSNPDP